jgi:two-component system, OmpR family, KDP operon response regulator KdpE
MPDISLLVVEDDPRMQRLLESQLSTRGFDVHVVGTGEEALDFVADNEPQVVLLDVSLPGDDGLTICRRLREWSEVPIILVTAADTPQLKVSALEQGADDYMTKPFHTGELVARIRAVLRRVNQARPLDKAIQEIDDLRINSLTREVFRGGDEVKLTRMEFDILGEFLRNPDKIITHQQLLDNVWGPGYDDVRSVHVHVCNLRRKIEADPTKRRRILTVQGIGYRFRLRED